MITIDHDAWVGRSTQAILLRQLGANIRTLKHYRKHLDRIRKGPGPDLSAKLLAMELRTLRGVVLQIHLIQQDRRTGGPPVHVNALLTAASVQYDVPPSSLYPEGSHVALDPLQAGVLAASEQIREEQRMERAAHDIAEARCFHLLGPPPCAGCLEQTRRDLDATIKAYQEQEHHGAPA